MTTLKGLDSNPMHLVIRMAQTPHFSQPLLIGTHLLFGLAAYWLGSYRAQQSVQPQIDAYKALMQTAQTTWIPPSSSPSNSTALIEHMQHSVAYARSYLDEAKRNGEEAKIAKQQLNVCLNNTESVMQVCSTNAQTLLEAERDKAACQENLVEKRLDLQSCNADLQEIIRAKARCWICV